MNLLVIGVPFAALILSNAFASAAIFNGVLQLTIFIVTAMIPGKLVVHLHKIKLVRVGNVCCEGASRLDQGIGSQVRKVVIEGMACQLPSS